MVGTVDAKEAKTKHAVVAAGEPHRVANVACYCTVEERNKAEACLGQ